MGIQHFDGTVDSDYLKEAAKRGEKVKRYSYELMHIQPGMKVLDIGCGPGIDVRQLAELVGPMGQAIGLDYDSEMLATATAENKLPNCTYVQGDVCALPFPDNTFDAVRAERLVQVLPKAIDLDTVMREIIRITKKDGSIVLVDTDWGTASVNYANAELTSRLLHFFAEKLRPRGFAGRELYALMKKHDVAITTIDALPICMLDFSETPFEEWLPREALAKGIATTAEIQDWVETLTEQNQAGNYFSQVSMVLVAGRKR